MGRHQAMFIDVYVQDSLYALFRICQKPRNSDLLDTSPRSTSWSHFLIVDHITASMAILLMATLSPTLQKILHQQPFTFLGRISFGIYLAHGMYTNLKIGPLLPLFKFLLAFFLKTGFGEIASFLYSVVILISCSIFFGYLVAIYIDRNCLQITIWIFNLLFGKLEKDQSISIVPDKPILKIHSAISQLKNLRMKVFPAKLPRNMTRIGALMVFCFCAFLINNILFSLFFEGKK